MEKFAVILTKDNNQKVISTHATKEEAFTAGETYNGTITKNAGVVSCVYGSVDEKDNLVDGKIQIHKVWI